MNSKDIMKKISLLLKDKLSINYNDNKYSILKFGNSYKIIDEIGGGEQGTVLRIQNDIEKEFALKFYTPNEEDLTKRKLERGLETFKKEIGITSKLNHKNIVKIITGGHAKWIESENRWRVIEGFNGASIDDMKGGAFLFYIMDVIDGQSLDKIFVSLAEDKNPINFKSIDERLYFFEKFISQTCLAIAYFNKEGVFHTDIKADNIRLSASDNNFIILDFGFARDLKKAGGLDVDEEYLDRKNLTHIKVYTDHESNNLRTREGKYSKVDMFQFCSLVLDILDEFKDIYGVNRYEGIKTILLRGCGKLSERVDMDHIYNDLKHNFIIKTPWKLQYKIGEYMTPPKFGKFYTHIVLPEHTLALITKELDSIIKTSDFQHLRGVKQLGPTIFVFPGANHTRFEHSLGAYHLAMKYLERLVPQAEFRKLCDPIEETIKLTSLSALLHDIGHYPYSHWIEELEYKFDNGEELDSHETRGCNIIKSGKIGEIITTWGFSDNVLDLLIGKKPKPVKESKEHTIRSIIDSQIDVDKLDYLVRDSIHCGVTYGKSIDIEILLSSLTVDKNTRNIGLTTKGRTTFNAVIDARNNMYEGVYWHKTVRSCEAMFKRFFYEYLSQSKITKHNVENLYKLTDSLFLNELLLWTEENPERSSLRKLIATFSLSEERNIYKPAYIYFKNNQKYEEQNITNFFRGLIDLDYEEIRNKSNVLVSELRREFNELKNIDDYDILLETTPLQQYNKIECLEDFEFWNPRKNRYDTTPEEINSNLKYLHENMQAYLFCNPVYINQLSDITQRSKFNEILGRI